MGANSRLGAYSNKYGKYLLTCVDIFSKYAFVLPLKTKQGHELVEAFQKILSTGRKHTKLQADQGTEFLKSCLRDRKNIDFFTVNSEVAIYSSKTG